MTAEPTLYAVVGATGTGKSEFALDLVETLRARGRDAEIIGADAMQLYRGMDIGTAKLPTGQRRGIPHHLIDVLDPVQDAAVAWYQEAARAAASEIFDRGKDAVLVGGSGLYVSSVLFDFRFPPRDEQLRARLEAELERDGIGALFERLRVLDPATAEKIDARNARRVVRALEVVELGETTHGGALPEIPGHWHAHRIFALDVDRAELVRRLDARVHDMWRDGLLAEVEHLREHGIEDGPTASRAIGYAQALDQLRGVLGEAEAIEQTQALTRRYARRQVSWFRRYADAAWLDPRECRPERALRS